MSETTEAPATEAPDPSATPTAEAPASGQQTPAPSGDVPPAEEAKPERKAWWQTRIDELTRRSGEAERKASLAEARYQEAIQRQQPTGEAPKPVVPGSQADIDRQIEARAAALMETRQREAAITRTIEAGNTAYSPQIFTAACNTLASLGANERPEFMAAVGDLDHGAAVLYHLGTHPDEAVALLGMTPTKMAIALAKMEAKVTAPPPPKPVSKAPAPIAPLESAGSSEEADVNDETLLARDPAKWLAAREKQVAGRGRR